MTGVQTCALPICFPVTIGGSIVLSQAFSTTSQSFDFASSILEADLIELNGLLPVNLYVVYDLTKIYCNEK